MNKDWLTALYGRQTEVVNRRRLNAARLNATAFLLDTAERRVVDDCCGGGEWVRMSDEEARAIATRLREIARELQ